MKKRVEEYFKNPRFVKDVKPLDGYVLQLTFDNDETKIYDMSDMLNGVFEPLKDKSLFDKVFVDENGNVGWDIVDPEDCNCSNRVDLCKDELYLDSIFEE